MTGYYDIVLGLIPLSLAGLTTALLLAGMSSAVAIPMASVVTVGLIGHALFVNGPVTPTPAGADRQSTADSASRQGQMAD